MYELLIAQGHALIKIHTFPRFHRISLLRPFFIPLWPKSQAQPNNPDRNSLRGLCHSLHLLPKSDAVMKRAIFGSTENRTGAFCTKTLCTRYSPHKQDSVSWQMGLELECYGTLCTRIKPLTLNHRAPIAAALFQRRTLSSLIPEQNCCSLGRAHLPSYVPLGSFE